MHIHILGICGTFMGGAALLAKALGHKVTGCDANVYPPMSTQLQAAGIELIEGYSAAQLDLKPDVFVIGNALSRGNALVEAILNSQTPYTSGAQWVGETLLQNRWVLAVAGTHGKTTTASLLAWVLDYAGFDPSFLIGGVPLNFGVSARLGKSDFFVIEADEYDTAFFDKRSKFVHYRPRTAILNNLEYDHADIFPDLAAIETQFHHLVRTVPSNGQVIVPTQSAALDRVLKRGAWASLSRFGLGGDFALGTVFADGSFEVLHYGALQGIVRSELLGAHNRDNMLAVIAAARHIGIAPSVAIEALASFKNVKRRMETVGQARGVTVIDDFAHHPTAIETTVNGLRAKLGKAQRILAVLEPRSNTMKLGTMAAQLPASLAQADLVFAYGEALGKNALGWDLAAALAPLGAKAQCFQDLTSLRAAIVRAAQAGDVVLCMSNGSFGGIHKTLLKELAA